MNNCPDKIIRRGSLFLRSLVGIFSQCLSRNRLLRALDWFEGTCDTSTTKSQRSRASIPSMRRPASKETTSDSVELWKFASCTSNVCDRMFDSWRYTRFSPRSMLSLRGLQQDQNPATFPLSNAVQYFPHDSTVCSHSCCECWESNEPSVCHKLRFVTARASLCTDQRMSGLPLRHMYKHFKTIWEQTFDKCSHCFQFFLFFE